MALPSGTNNQADFTAQDPQSNSGGLKRGAVIRIIKCCVKAVCAAGSYILLCAGLIMFAGLALIPQYATLKYRQYQRDCKLVRLEEARTQTEGLRLLVQDLPNDETLAKRMLFSHLGMVPVNQEIYTDISDDPAPDPGTIAQVHLPDPPRPDNWALRKADQLKIPQKRRGYMLMTGLFFFSAFMLSMSKKQAKSKANSNPSAN